jgi:(1->4)-alpha-D-glucan 1-alpha-D-glucosylmutase
MTIPRATYRLQFSPAFDFVRAKETLSYLKDLGVSHIYASPVFEAMPGSHHGYDLVDPNRISSDLGGENRFLDLLTGAKELNLSWIQDIVPNHMAFDGRNRMLAQVLELGRSSDFSGFFDLWWDEPGSEGRLLAPFLGRSLEECLAAGEIEPGFDAQGFHLTYFQLRLPLSLESYPVLFTSPKKRPELDALCQELEALLAGPDDAAGAEPALRLKQAFIRLWQDNQEVRNLVQTRLARLARPQPLADLLSRQRFELAPWQEAAGRINYRRFFDINGLICLKQEEAEVFAETHGLVLDLVRQGLIQGLRVDHVDGLYDPAEYLNRLREAAGQVYLVVEKILADGEEPPPAWPVAGTTGYDFTAQLGALFRPRDNGPEFQRIYTRFSGVASGCRKILRKNKKRLLETTFHAELERLCRLFSQLGKEEEPDQAGLESALIQVLARFPVYRTYGAGRGLGPMDRALVQEVLAETEKDRPDLKNSLDLVARVILSRTGDPAGLRALARLEQLSGPLMAKGLEDTTFYQYNLLLSLNEVGSSPALFGSGAKEFHHFNQRRLAAWPGAMNATATHDTKRGEDARARLNALSEMPQEWERMLGRWSALNQDHKTRLKGRPVPDRNEEYLLYQTLLAVYPQEAGFDRRRFTGRIKDFLRKALREAKVNSSWLDPREDYEAACLSFADRILDPGRAGLFLKSFLPFQRRIAALGMINSLSQVLLKLICPGVPDLYQGTELWDLSLVDPDNRGQVDFELRRETLDRLRAGFKRNPEKLLKELVETREDGRLKLFILHRGLTARLGATTLFAEGEYLSPAVTGPLAGHLVAVARSRGKGRVMGLTPRFLAGLLDQGELPLGPGFWGRTKIKLPWDGPCFWRDVLTGRKYETNGEIVVGQVLKDLPVSLLTGKAEP